MRLAGPCRSWASTEPPSARSPGPDRAPETSPPPWPAPSTPSVASAGKRSSRPGAMGGQGTTRAGVDGAGPAITADMVIIRAGATAVTAAPAPGRLVDAINAAVPGGADPSPTARIQALAIGGSGAGTVDIPASVVV